MTLLGPCFRNTTRPDHTCNQSLRKQLAALLLCCLIPYPAYSCEAVRTDEKISVRHVYDGDTVLLTDGRKLRFLGLNAPETRGQKHFDPIPGKNARQYVRKLLNRHENILFLQHDSERQDRYGRLLAHAFLSDGRNLAQILIEQGLATALIIPPNVQLADCYSSKENSARNKQRGIWKRPENQPLALKKLEPKHLGYRIIHGPISKIQHRNDTVFLYFRQHGKTLRVKVTSKDRHFFPNGFFAGLTGRHMEVRGWLHMTKGRFYMRSRHPSTLQILPH